MDDPATLIAIALIYVVAGTVKGTVGVGLPTTAIGLSTLVLDPRAAIAAVLFPMLFSNGWQVWRTGHTIRTVRRYGWFMVILMLGVGVTVLLSASASDRLMFGFLGTTIVIFVVVNVCLTIPPLPANWDRPAQISMGIVAGIMGGLTAVWAPPMVIYLAAKRIDKDEFVRATGVLILMGSLPLTLGYAQNGDLTAEIAVISALLILPTLLGFSIGERLRARMSQHRFRSVLMGVFFVLGLNLLRRAIW